MDRKWMVSLILAASVGFVVGNETHWARAQTAPRGAPLQPSPTPAPPGWEMPPIEGPDADFQRAMTLYQAGEFQAGQAATRDWYVHTPDKSSPLTWQRLKRLTTLTEELRRGRRRAKRG
jgi:hypothetical protein